MVIFFLSLFGFAYLNDMHYDGYIEENSCTSVLFCYLTVVHRVKNNLYYY